MLKSKNNSSTQHAQKNDQNIDPNIIQSKHSDQSSLIEAKKTSNSTKHRSKKKVIMYPDKTNTPDSKTEIEMMLEKEIDKETMDFGQPLAQISNNMLEKEKKIEELRKQRNHLLETKLLYEEQLSTFEKKYQVVLEQSEKLGEQLSKQEKLYNTKFLQYEKERQKQDHLLEEKRELSLQLELLRQTLSDKEDEYQQAVEANSQLITRTGQENRELLVKLKSFKQDLNEKENLLKNIEAQLSDYKTKLKDQEAQFVAQAASLRQANSSVEKLQQEIVALNQNHAKQQEDLKRNLTAKYEKLSAENEQIRNSNLVIYKHLEQQLTELRESVDILLKRDPHLILPADIGEKLNYLKEYVEALHESGRRHPTRNDTSNFLSTTYLPEIYSQNPTAAAYLTDELKQAMEGVKTFTTNAYKQTNASTSNPLSFSSPTFTNPSIKSKFGNILDPVTLAITKAHQDQRTFLSKHVNKFTDSYINHGINDVTKNTYQEIDLLTEQNILTSLTKTPQQDNKIFYNLNGRLNVEQTYNDQTKQLNFNIRPDFEGVITIQRMNKNKELLSDYDILHYKQGKIVDIVMAAPLPTQNNCRIYDIALSFFKSQQINIDNSEIYLRHSSDEINVNIEQLNRMSNPPIQEMTQTQWRDRVRPPSSSTPLTSCSTQSRPVSQSYKLAGQPGPVSV